MRIKASVVHANEEGVASGVLLVRERYKSHGGGGPTRTQVEHDSTARVHLMGTPGMGVIAMGGKSPVRDGDLKELSIPNGQSD